MMPIGFKMNLQTYLLLRMKKRHSLCAGDGQVPSFLALSEVLRLITPFQPKEAAITRN